MEQEEPPNTTQDTSPNESGAGNGKALEKTGRGGGLGRRR